MPHRAPLLTDTLALGLALAAALAPAAARAGGPADGTIQSDAARIEILGKPVRVGETIELPEGFLRVEEEGTEDERVGSFSVVPAATLRATADARTRAAPQAPAAAGAPDAASPEVAALVARAATDPACREQRSAYLRELWKMSGIEVKDPEALIEGLEGPAQGARTGFFWFALATDPFRPLAWSSDLRSRADALASCVRTRAAGSKVAGR
jgi:hypothetical protein